MTTCTLGTELGRCKAFHTDHNCPDRLKSCLAFTTMMPEEGEVLAWRLSTSTRCGVYTHSQVGCRRPAQECLEIPWRYLGGGPTGDNTSQPFTRVLQ